MGKLRSLDNRQVRISLPMESYTKRLGDVFGTPDAERAVCIGIGQWLAGSLHLAANGSRAHVQGGPPP